jgi:hypothetical protein
MLKSIAEEMNTSFLETDVFFIDANVLIFLYGPPAKRNEQKSAAYSNFIQKLRSAGCNLCVSSLNAQEFFHVMEKIHHEKYRKDKATSLTIKKYRKLFPERRRLARIQQTIWCELQGAYAILQEQINPFDLDMFVKSYANHRYEPIDYIVADHHKPIHIITDDQDFANDENVVAYTFFNTTNPHG